MRRVYRLRRKALPIDDVLFMHSFVGLGMGPCIVMLCRAYYKKSCCCVSCRKRTE